MIDPMLATNRSLTPSYVHVQLVRERTCLEAYLSSSRAVYDYCMREALFAPYTVKEAFFALHLDGGNKVFAVHLVTVGTLTSTLVHPREVFAPALINHACSIIVCHNHPSGDPAPSPEDVEITHRLIAAGRLLGVPLKDHVIVGQERWKSMHDMGVT